MSKWDVHYTDQYERDYKRVNKAYPRELEQMLINSKMYVDALDQHGNPLLVVRYPFVHRESSGCHAITQQPLKSVAQTRLYVYAYVAKSTVYFLCIGDKQSQQKDNRYCQNFVKDLNNN